MKLEGSLNHADASSMKSFIANLRPNLQQYESLYRRIHANPKLSHQESETAAFIELSLKDLSPKFEIRTKIGGHGLIAILRHGQGKTVLLRADMDALPVAEKTGLDYSSRRTQLDAQRKKTAVMHACGHDMHVVCLLIAAETLLAVHALWSGTIVFRFQPAEEAGDGALGMVDDGLFDPNRHACPLPDMVLAQHVAPI
ncbi:hypothetical protein LTR46_011758 [Exophiala xenobiotica]|nr:hypothetical protein LTR46_011758 [Exophiala xenobiotica]